MFEKSKVSDEIPFVDLNLLFESIDDMIIIYDMQGKVVSANRACKKITGFEIEEFIGKNFSELGKRPGKKSKKGGFSLPPIGKNVSSFINKDGNARFIGWSSVFIEDENGGYSGILSTGRDVTEDKLSQQYLEDSAQKYRKIFEFIPIPIFEEDYSKIKEYIDNLREKGIIDFRAYFETKPEEIIKCVKLVEYIDANQAGYEIGDSNNIEEMQNDFVKIVKKDPLQFLEELVFISEGAKTKVIERIRKMRDSEIVIRTIITVAPGHEHDYSKIYVVLLNITKDKRAIESIRKSQIKYEILNEKFNLISRLTRHDIRNQLFNITANIDLMKKKVTNPEVEKNFSRIDTTVDRISKLIERTKPIENLGMEDRHILWLREEIDKAIGLLPEKTDIEINYNVQPLKLYADSMLSILFYNLIDNSIRHGEKVTKIEISYRPLTDSMKIYYEDNGVGIIKQKRDILFKKKPDDSYIHGLYLCRKIIESYGWNIEEKREEKPRRKIRYIHTSKK